MKNILVNLVMSIFFTKDLRAVWLKNIFPKVDIVIIIEGV